MMSYPNATFGRIDLLPPLDHGKSMKFLEASKVLGRVFGTNG